MSTVTDRVETVPDVNHPPEMVHVGCVPCGGKRALCGYDTSDRDWKPRSTDVDCVVCVEMWSKPCPDCGRPA